MRQAGKGMQRLLDHPRRQAQAATGRIGSAGILVVVLARQALDLAQVDRPDLLGLAPFRQEPLAGIDQPARPRQLAPHRHPDHPVIARRLAQLVRQVKPLGLVHADHRTIRPALGKQPALGREIPAQSGMTIQVIGAEIGEDRHIRRQRPRQVGLVARQFQHHDAAILGRVDIQHAAPDIPGQLRLAPGLDQDVMDQRRGGGFPVRAGHGHDPRLDLVIVPVLRRDRPKEQPDIIVDRDPLLQRRRHDRVRLRIKMRNPRADDQRRHPFEGAGAGQVHNGEPLRIRRLARGGVVVPAQGHRTARPQGARRHQARPAQPQHRHLLSFDTFHRDHATASSLAARGPQVLPSPFILPEILCRGVRGDAKSPRVATLQQAPK